MKIDNNSGTLQEAATIISAMSQEQRNEFYDELFRYEPSRPCTVEHPSNAEPTER